MTTTLYFKRLLSISLLSAAFVLAASPSFAQSPQAVSKDKQRLANYVNVINSYIAEVKGAIASTDPIFYPLTLPEPWYIIK